MVLIVLFWIIWLLCVIGVFIPEQPWISRGRWVFVLVMLGILAVKILGNPIH